MQNNIERYDLGWTSPNNTNSEFAFSDSLSEEHTSDNIYSPSIKILINDSLVGYNNIFARFETKYLDISDSVGANIFYKAFHIKRLPDNVVGEWQTGSIGFNIPTITDEMASMKFYIWNSNKQVYYLDDLSIKLYTYSNGSE